MRESYPVIDGAESFFFKGNEIGVLITHGFNGTPQSIKSLGEKFTGLGYTIHAPRLKGHGTHYKDLEKTTWNEWFSDLEKGYRFLKEQKCSSIFIIGQSMGGTLSLWLANKYPEIKGVILINAALSIPSYDYLIGKINPSFVDETEPDIKLEGVHEIAYKKLPIFAIHQLQTLIKATPDILVSIKNPILCFKSIDDHVVPHKNTDYILKHVQSDQKEVYPLKNSYHVASMDHEKDTIVDETHHFIEKQLKQKKVPHLL
jgi:carboxylesterase